MSAEVWLMIFVNAVLWGGIIGYLSAPVIEWVKRSKKRRPSKPSGR